MKIPAATLRPASSGPMPDAAAGPADAAPPVETAEATPERDVAADGFVSNGTVAADPVPPHKVHGAVIEDFYAAFAAHDGAAMATAYHPDAVFTDAAFGTLRGTEIGAMWKMLTAGSGDLVVQADGIKAGDKSGRAHWTADYPFPATGRQVHNDISAKFRFRDGKIIRHDDSFDFQKWAGQAFGLNRFGFLGRALAGSSLLQKTMQHFARRQLHAFMRKNNIPIPD